MSKRDQPEKQQGNKYVTQKDVAIRAGVSPSIVSYVINNGPRSISEETRQRVLRAIEELNYRPNVHAQKLMLASWENELAPNQFGILVGGGRDFLVRPYYLNIIYGILDEAVQKSQSLRFIIFFDDLYNPHVFNKLIHPEEISSLLIIKGGPKLWSNEGSVMLERIRARVPNVVSVGRSLAGLPSVTFDLSQAIQTATSHLIELGHTQIAYIGTKETRLAGYENAFREHQLPIPPELVYPVRLYNTTEDGYLECQKLIAGGRLQGDHRVTGIVAASDEVAWGIMRAVQEAGLRIPEDVSIIAIDDANFNVYLVPALTTVRIPKEEIVRNAVHLMLQRKGRTNESPEIVYLPTELILRDSCGPVNG